MLVSALECADFALDITLEIHVRCVREGVIVSFRREFGDTQIVDLTHTTDKSVSCAEDSRQD